MSDNVDLREYLEVRLAAIKESTDLARSATEKSLASKLESIKEATELARIGIEKRLEGMNEFRDPQRCTGPLHNQG